jgi:cytoskeletal protein RodZ
MRGVFEDEEVEPVKSRRDAELTLGFGTLLGIFGCLVLLCALCFWLGYAMGRRGPEPSLIASSQPAPGAAVPAPSEGSQDKPSAGEGSAAASTETADSEPVDSGPSSIAAAPTAEAPPAAAQPMQQPIEPAAQETIKPAMRPAVRPPKAAAKAPAQAPSQTPAQMPAPVREAAKAPAQAAAKAPVQTLAQAAPVHPALAATMPAQHPALSASAPAVQPALGSEAELMVQIAVVRDPDDAAVLISALRKRGYEVNVRREQSDGFYHVRIGPFRSRGDAEAMKDKLLNDGYNAVVQP